MDTTPGEEGSVLDTWRNAPVTPKTGDTPSSIMSKLPVIYTTPSSGYIKQLSANTMASPMNIMQPSTSAMHASMYTEPSDIHNTSPPLSHNLSVKPYAIPAESRPSQTKPYYTTPSGSRTFPTEPYMLPLVSRTLYKPLSVMTSQEEEPDDTEVKPPLKPSFNTLHRRRLSAQYRYTGTPLIKYTDSGPKKSIGAIPRPVPISRPAPIILPQMSANGNPMLSSNYNIAAVAQSIFNPNVDKNMMSYMIDQMIYQQYYNNSQVFWPPLQPQQQQTANGGMVHKQGQHMFSYPGLSQQQLQFYSVAGLPMSVPSPFGYAAAAAAETPHWQDNAVSSSMIAPPPPPPPPPPPLPKSLLLPHSSMSPSLLQQQQQQQSASVPKTTATAVRSDDYIDESYMDSCTGGGVNSPRTLLSLNTSETPLPPNYGYRYRENYWPRSPPRSPPPPYVVGKRRNNSDWPPRSPPPPYAEWNSEHVSSSSSSPPSRHYYPNAKKARRY